MPARLPFSSHYDVHAATDVTGFGLLGHLVEMVRASDVDVTIAPDQVPLLDGARETVARGIFSSLQPQNVRLRRAIRDLERPRTHPLYPLLFDPQTAGGLLAAVPLARAKACITDLRAAGYPQAVIIGFVSPRGIRARACVHRLGVRTVRLPRHRPPPITTQTSHIRRRSRPMPKNPFTDVWQFLTATTGDYMALGDWRFLLLALFWALFIGSIVIAMKNWKEDPEQRSGAPYRHLDRAGPDRLHVV